MPPTHPTITVLNYSPEHWAVSGPAEFLAHEMPAIEGKWDDGVRCWLVPKGEPGIQLWALAFKTNESEPVFRVGVSDFSTEPTPPIIREAIEAQREHRYRRSEIVRQRALQRALERANERAATGSPVEGGPVGYHLGDDLWTPEMEASRRPTETESGLVGPCSMFAIVGAVIFAWMYLTDFHL